MGICRLWIWNTVVLSKSYRLFDLVHSSYRFNEVDFLFVLTCIRYAWGCVRLTASWQLTRLVIFWTFLIPLCLCLVCLGDYTCSFDQKQRFTSFLHHLILSFGSALPFMSFSSRDGYRISLSWGSFCTFKGVDFDNAKQGNQHFEFLKGGWGCHVNW